MKAEIRKKAASEIKEEQRLLGEGEKLKLQAIAEGQRAQMEVLGQEKTYQLARLKLILEAATGNPDIVQVPRVLVNGSSGGFEGAAAILGANNLTFGLGDSSRTVTEEPQRPRKRRKKPVVEEIKPASQPPVEPTTTSE